jgi:DNA-binding NtrC family response regulator
MKDVDPEAMDYLKTLPWTGNVRELRNVVERLVIMCNEIINIEDVKLFAMPVI